MHCFGAVRALVVATLLLTFACSSPTDSAPALPQIHLALATTTAVTVTTVIPSEAPRSVTLDVQINGSGFDKGSKVTMPLRGVDDPRVRINSTRYVKSTQVIASVTISSDAELAGYDVVVTTTSGKKGIGTEAFVVVILPEVLAGGYHVNDVNTSGDAIGDVTNPRYPQSCATPALQGLWRADGTRVTLPMNGYCGGSPQAINSSGVILTNLSGGTAHSGLWVPSGSSFILQELPATPDGVYPIAPGAFNDNNEIFGWVQGAPKLVWWSATTGWLPVQVPAGATACQSFRALNNRGEMAARCTVNGSGNPYYWSSHDAAPVALPRPAAAGDVSPHDMNDSGVIVGGGPSGGLRWRPTPSGYVMDQFTVGGAGVIAADGTMGGSVPGKNGASGPSPAIFFAPDSYQMLGLTTNGKWGEVREIVATPTGLLVGGTESNAKALRWRVPR
jgi:hypothetical protein